MRPLTVPPPHGTNVEVFVPSPLRQYCEGARKLMLAAPTVRATLEELERSYPSLYRSVCDETGAVRQHINVFVNSTHMRDREGLDTALPPVAEGAKTRKSFALRGPFAPGVATRRSSTHATRLASTPPAATPSSV